MARKKKDKVNSKVIGKRYKYMHSGDCIIYITECNNCKKEISGWSAKQADENWEKHFC